MRRYSFILSAIFLITIAGPSSAVQPLLDTMVNYLTGSFPMAVCSADMDGDGYIDIVALRSTDDLAIMLNNGDGTFYAGPTYESSGDPYAVYASDIDLDGDMDLVLPRSADDSIEVLLNAGDATFPVTSTYAAGDQPRTASVVDLNGDYYPDIAAYNFTSDDFSILINDGSGSFAAAVNYTAGNSANKMSSADLDGDGDIDLVCSNYLASNFTVMLNNGDGTFTTITNYSAGAGPDAIAPSDYDHDGDIDLAIVNMFSDDVTIHMNAGDGSFPTRVAYDILDTSYDIKAGDFNGDGWDDLAVPSAFTDEIVVLLNDGDGTFSAAVPFQAGDNPRAITVADFNGDLMPDAATSNQSSHNISVFLNLSSPDIASVRDVPGDQGGQVFLSWRGAREDINMTGSITHYSIWRTIDQIASASATARGIETTKEVPELLPGEERDLVRIEMMAGTTYYWELIETIDALFMEGYGRPVATLFDSTAASADHHYFQVIAHTATPAIFLKSAPDSGYSVDNITPSFPEDLQGTPSIDPLGLLLTWKPGEDSDLDHYDIYRGTRSDFQAEDDCLVAVVTDPEYFDTDWSGTASYYYKLRSVDSNGNASPFSMLRPEDITGSEPGDIPTAAFLGQNYPNPFNPSTTISFGLTKTQDVVLKIYDTSGRLIRTLLDGSKEAGIHAESWDGLNSTGSRVASGIYYYRIITDTYTDTKKMVLLK